MPLIKRLLASDIVVETSDTLQSDDPGVLRGS
jgi:hypothetical protein